ncbi:MAG: hypothetical protein Q7K57_25770 [Burkholderiaceae bacterium]|nr:hypothetical protein [Burkholderiaceae bacterium]
MKVEAVLIYEKGRGITSKIRTGMTKYRGNLRIREGRVQELGRIATIADLTSTTDGADSPVLPSLHDANVIFIDSGNMRIRGFEVIEGTQYAQTWDLKVA